LGEEGEQGGADSMKGKEILEHVPRAPGEKGGIMNEKKLTEKKKKKKQGTKAAQT